MTRADIPDRDRTAHLLEQEAIRRLAGRRDVDLDLPAMAVATGIGLDEVHRVFPTEEDLLTALILNAYNAMSDSAEQAGADADGGGLLDRWVAVCRGVRRWALAHPDEYALIWGQPIPGYVAPQETMTAGARTVLALLSILHDARKAGQLAEHPAGPPWSAGMRRTVDALAEGILQGLPDPVIARMLIAWTQLHGMVAFEVYGHIAGVAADPAAFFDHAASAVGEYVGLPR